MSGGGSAKPEGGLPRRGVDSLRVNEASILLAFLRSRLHEEGRNTLKSLLAHHRILVNGRVVARFDFPLSEGDRVLVVRGRGALPGDAAAPLGPESEPLLGMRILFEDEHLIVAEKEAGLLSIATDKERERTAYHLLTDHVRRMNPAGRLFIVHRLDRESSGVMLFAKSAEAKRRLQGSWREAVEKRSYAVVVEGVISSSGGTITSWLKEDRSLVMRSSPVDNGGKRAVTHYRVLSRGDRFTLLEVELETGRKNQIRAQMQSIGHSVAGDLKYGASGNPIGRLALHAHRLAFRHPVTGRSMSFESPVPKPFFRLLKPALRAQAHAISRPKGGAGSGSPSDAKARPSATPPPGPKARPGSTPQSHPRPTNRRSRSD